MKNSVWILLLTLISIVWYSQMQLSLSQSVSSRGYYTIEKAQSPLALGLAGHNYLILRDDTGRIISELHGLPIDETGTIDYYRITSGAVLQATELTPHESRTPHGSARSEVLATGPQEIILARWSRGRSCIPDINNQNIPYPPLGITFSAYTSNSNSVESTLVFCMGLREQETRLGISSPGEHNILLPDARMKEVLSLQP